jgi:polysaccharide export outer membrane protein
MKQTKPVVFSLVLVLAAAAAGPALFASGPQLHVVPPNLTYPKTTFPPNKPAVMPDVLPEPPPSDYVIGADDVLIVLFRREKDMSEEVAVRSDGKITLQVLNDIQAAGLTPDQLRDKITDEAKKLIEDPSVTIVVKQINSRKVFITGQVTRPGAYPMGTRINVVQLIALAGGLTEYAKPKSIVIYREPIAGAAAPVATPGGKPGAKPAAPPPPKAQVFKFDYAAFQKLKNLAANIYLHPGDTVIVP